MHTRTHAHAITSSNKVLERAAKQKKDKHLDACLERRRTFAPWAYYVDGMTWKEAKAFEKRVVLLLAKKLGQQYSKMVGFVHTRMPLAVVHSNTLLLRGARGGRLMKPLLHDGAAFDALDRGVNES